MYKEKTSKDIVLIFLRSCQVRRLSLEGFLITSQLGLLLSLTIVFKF